MKKQVIVLIFNGGNSRAMEEGSTNVIFPGLSTNKNIDHCEESHSIGGDKLTMNNFLPIYTPIPVMKQEGPSFILGNREAERGPENKEEENESCRNPN